MDQSKLLAAISVPEQKSGQAPLELNPKTLQMWRDALPLANLQETTRRVYNLLRDTNRLKIPEKIRLPFLEALIPSIDYVTGGLSKACQGHAHPLPEKVTKLVRLNQELLQEAAIGHKILVRDMLGRRFLFGSKERLVGDCMQAVLHYLGRVVIESYRTYVPFPDGVWGEVHAIYRLAEARRLMRVKSQHFSQQGRLTLADSYKRIILLALASPYHLERGVINAINDCLTEWSSACELEPLDGREDDELLIVINLDDNAPPSFHVREGGRERNDLESCRVLDSVALSAIIDREIDRIAAQREAGERKADAPLSPEVLQILRDCWSGPTTRAESRYHGDVEVQIAVGLNAVHYFITHGHGRPEPGPSAETGAADADVARQEEEPGDGAELALAVDGAQETRRDRIAELLLPADAAKSWTELRSAHVPDSYACRTIDFSANGCQLLCPQGSKLTLSVGDLVGIGFDDTPSGRWKIGTVRWIRQRKQGDTQIGVRIIANEAHGIKAGVCDDSGYANDLSDGIQVVGARHEATLVTPRMPFAKGKLVLVEDDGEERYLRLGENIESSSRFARFLYAPIRKSEAERILAERNRPVSKIGEKQLKAAMEGKSTAQEILDDTGGVWDGMRHDW